MRCILSQVPVAAVVVGPGRPDHVPMAVKCCTAFETMAGRMAAVITILLWQAALAAQVFFLEILSFLLELTLANLDKAEARWKAASPPGMVNAALNIPTFWCVDCILMKPFLLNICR